MLHNQDARFPISTTWSEAIALAATTLSQRRDGAKLLLRVTPPLALLALVMDLGHRTLESHGLGRLLPIVTLLALTAAAALVVLSVSMVYWRMRLHSLRRQFTAASSAKLRAGCGFLRPLALVRSPADKQPKPAGTQAA